MWLFVSIPQFPKKDALESFLDELMTLSPEIFLGPGQGAYLKLRSVHHFWKLSEFLRNKEEKKQQHPFYKVLERLNHDYGCDFIMAETPAECSWVRAHRASQPRLELVPEKGTAPFFFLLQKNDRYHDLLAESPIREIEAWLIDLVESDEKIATDLHLFCDGLSYIGIKNLLELNVALSQKDFLQSALFRFGRILKNIHDRLRGSEEFHMHPYEPPMHLRVEFYPELEKNMSVEASEEIPQRLLEILCKWERRLEARKSLLSGLEVTLETAERSCLPNPHRGSTPDSRNLPAQKKVLRALFPHPLRDPNFIHQIFLEKWTSSREDEVFFDQPIEKVKVRSIGLQRATEHQLHLFDHTDEDVYQEWGLLLGKLYNRAEGDVQVGSFEAKESFIPEKSVEFKNWSPGQKFQIIGDHPERPQLLEKRPREVLRDVSEEDFLKILAEKSNLRSLEVIAQEENDERLYGRVADDWVFYDPRQKKVLKHGAF